MQQPAAVVTQMSQDLEFRVFPSDSAVMHRSMEKQTLPHFERIYMLLHGVMVTMNRIIVLVSFIAKESDFIVMTE